MKIKSRSVHRGDIFYADLNPVVGSEQGGVRPVLIVQNEVGNAYSPTVIVAAITSQQGKCKLPTHIAVNGGVGGLERSSIILLEQVRTIDKKRLHGYVGSLDPHTMTKINKAITLSMGTQEEAR